LLQGRRAGKADARGTALAAALSLGSLGVGLVLVALFARVDPGGVQWRL